jgi:hypothetical protein
MRAPLGDLRLARQRLSYDRNGSKTVITFVTGMGGKRTLSGPTSSVRHSLGAAMKHSVARIVAKAVLGGVLACGTALASSGKGPKIVEIDEAGNVKTSSGTDVGQTKSQNAKPDSAKSPVPRDSNSAMSICDPRYRWLPSGVSADTVTRARVFYRDVTLKYEQAETVARKQGGSLSRAREIEYWDAYKHFLDSVPRNERKVVERGISPRLSWWCNAPPVIQKGPPLPPAPVMQKAPPPPPPLGH